MPEFFEKLLKSLKHFLSLQKCNGNSDFIGEIHAIGSTLWKFAL